MAFSELFATFANNLLPIMVISAGGFLVGRYLSVDARTIGRLAFYIFLPVLVFNLLLHNELPGDKVGKVVLYVVLLNCAIGLIAFFAARLMQLERTTTLAVIITAMFANSGNYGLPLVSLAFGGDAAAYAGIYFATSSIMFNTVGVVVASLGHLNIKQALTGLLKVPMIYGVILGALFNRFDIILPLPLDRTIAQLAGGAIPIMLVLLGIELSKAKWSHNLRGIGISATLRLLIGPLLGIGLATLLGLGNAARQAAVTEGAMPSAVSNTVLASEYKLDSSFVTAIVFVSTLLSPLTLTPLLVFLGK